MAIPDEDVAAVRAQTDLVALIGEHLSLRRQGRRWVGLCPFHTEKTPSFSVNPEQGLYYCFGCQASGDAITFLRTIEHLDFVEAVERLAARAGVAIHHQGGDRRVASSQRERLLAAMETVQAADLRRLLRYDATTAGGLMTSQPLVVPPDTPVAEVLAQIREPEMPITAARTRRPARPR